MPRPVGAPGRPCWLGALLSLPLVLCDGAGAPPCNDTCDTANRVVDAAYVPYGWCVDVATEATHLHRAYTCTSAETDLRGENVVMTVAPDGDLEDSLRVVGVEVEACVEVVSWWVDVVFTSSAFAATIPSAVEVYAMEGEDRTELFQDLYDAEAVEGWLFDGVQGDLALSIVSDSDVGDPEKRWSVRVGNFDSEVVLTCE